jgi:hypothetical protein
MQTLKRLNFLHFAFCILNYTLFTSCSNPPSPIQISQSGVGAYEAALATDGDGLAVAWYDTRDGNAEIYLRRLDGNGRPSGPERRLTDSPEASYEASLESLPDAFAVAWYEQPMKGPPTAMLGVWTRDGNQQWSRAIAPASRNPVIRADQHTIVAAWIQAEADGTEAVWIGRWDQDGHEMSVRTRVGAASKDTWNLNLALDGSDAWVVYDGSAATRSSEVFLGRVHGSTVRLDRLTRDDGSASKYPDLQIGDEGRLALTWYDARDGNDEVYLFVGRAADLQAEIDDRARRVTTTEAESVGAYLAWNSGYVGLAWSDKAPGAHEIYFQAFNAAGMPLAAARRLTHSDTWSLVPAIRPWKKGFALAWTEYKPASSQLHGGTGEVDFMLIE